MHRRAITSIVLLALLSAPSGAQPADKVLGLLALQKIFGNYDGPCGDEQFTPADVPVYSAPGSNVILGTIRVDRSPASGAERECSVNVHWRKDGHVSALEPEAYSYEGRALIVLQHHGRWFKLRLADRAGWVHASERDRFFALQTLLSEHRDFATLTQFWDRRLADSPGGALERLLPHPRRHLIGYLTPITSKISIEVEPGQNPKEIRKRYANADPSTIGSVQRPDGTISLVYFDEGVQIDAFERPDAHAPAVFRFPNYDAHLLRGRDRVSPSTVFIFDRRPGWFQVARRSEAASQSWIAEPRLWIKESPAWQFHPVDDNAERERLANDSWGPEYEYLRVMGFRRVGAELWVEVELLDHSDCDSTEKPVALRRGWIPAHDRSGEATISFYAEC